MKQLVALCALLVCSLVSSAAADAPAVAETVPKADASDVNPATREIRVVFDQAMDHGGMSIVGGGPKYPRGAPHPARAVFRI